MERKDQGKFQQVVFLQGRSAKMNKFEDRYIKTREQHGCLHYFSSFWKADRGQQSVNLFRAKRMIGQVILVLEQCKENNWNCVQLLFIVRVKRFFNPCLALLYASGRICYDKPQSLIPKLYYKQLSMAEFIMKCIKSVRILWTKNKLN